MKKIVNYIVIFILALFIMNFKVSAKEAVCSINVDSVTYYGFNIYLKCTQGHYKNVSVYKANDKSKRVLYRSTNTTEFYWKPDIPLQPNTKYLIEGKKSDNKFDTYYVTTSKGTLKNGGCEVNIKFNDSYDAIVQGYCNDNEYDVKLVRTINSFTIFKVSNDKVDINKAENRKNTIYSNLKLDKNLQYIFFKIPKDKFTKDSYYFATMGVQDLSKAYTQQEYSSNVIKYDEKVNETTVQATEVTNIEEVLRENSTFNSAVVKRKGAFATSNKEIKKITTGDFCDPGLKKLISKYLGYIQFLVPFGLMILITIDYLKAMASNDQNLITKATNNSIKRTIAGLLILLLPTILTLIFNLFGLSEYICF